MNPSFVLSMTRKLNRQLDNNKLTENIRRSMNKVLVKVRNWEANPDYRVQGPNVIGLNIYEFTCKIIFTRVKVADSEQVNIEVLKIRDYINKLLSSQQFKNQPWVSKITSNLGFNLTEIIPSERNDVSDVVDFDKAKKLEEIDIPEMLVSGTDEEIEQHPAFFGIFGRAAHIRVAFSSIKTMKMTNGQRRNHCLFHGLPGCAKSTLFKGIQHVLGKGAFLSINANSATRAGIEAIFFKKLPLTGTPPIFFIEEIEKTQEQILTAWLSILDERAEVRKVTHTDAMKAEARILCFATANDKVLFDNLMGGRKGHAGALSSRFTKPLYVPRPSDEIMKKILLRDIKMFGGHKEWADKCIEIGKATGTTDPRTILGYLDGADRLMDGTYKSDILTIKGLETIDNMSEEEKNNVA